MRMPQRRYCCCIFSGAAYADVRRMPSSPEHRAVLIAAVDPGRPGGPLDTPALIPPRIGKSTRRKLARAPPLAPTRRSRKPGQQAQRYTEALRARLLGLQPPAPDTPTPARAPGRQAAATQAAQAESVRRAVEELDLSAPQIRLSARGRGVVGAPIWLWLAGGQALASPTSATAAVGAAAVTATAHLVSVEWTLGPPGARVVCAGPGTPWTGQTGTVAGLRLRLRAAVAARAHRRDGAVADRGDDTLAGRLAGHLGRRPGGRAGGPGAVQHDRPGGRGAAGAGDRRRAMTATTSPPMASGRPAAAGGSARQVPRRRRRSRLVLVGVLLAILGAVGGVLTVGQVSRRVAVVAVARPVAFGQTVSALDLRSVLLPLDTELATVAWDRSGGLVGQVAATDLLPGQILTPDAVTTARPPAPGSAVVGVALEPGRLPATPLLARDRVLVVDAGATAGAGTDAVVLRADPGGAGAARRWWTCWSPTSTPRRSRGWPRPGRVVVVLVSGR